MPVIAWLGIAGGGMRGREPVRPTPLPLPAPARIAMLAAAALVALAAAVSLALPWISARLTDSAATGWPDDPQEAYSRLDTARDLNPLSARPDLVAGTIAIRDDDPTRAAAAFARAAEREPTNWYARLELGTLDLADGDRGRGVAELQRARELNPDEPLIATAIRRSRGSNPLSTGAIDRDLLARVCSRVGATQQTRYCKN
jgi:predicted Zn-dependent protease